MSRITERFARLKADKRAGLVAYVSAGDPNPELGYQILKGLPGAGEGTLDELRSRAGLPNADVEEVFLALT